VFHKTVIFFCLVSFVIALCIVLVIYIYYQILQARKIVIYPFYLIDKKVVKKFLDNLYQFYDICLVELLMSKN